MGVCPFTLSVFCGLLESLRLCPQGNLVGSIVGVWVTHDHCYEPSGPCITKVRGM